MGPARSALEACARPRARLALVAALGLAAASAALTRTDGLPVAPLDDAYIYYQYAAAMAQGRGLAYFPGDPPTGGATSLLWCLLQLPAALAGLDPVLWSWLLGFAALFAATTAAASLVERRAGPAWAGLATLLVATSGPLAWAAASGMETLLYAALLVHALDRVDAARAPALAPAGASPPSALPALFFLPFARPEGSLVAFLLALPLGPRPLAAALAGAFGQAGLLFALTGSPLGSGFAVKSLLAIPHLPASEAFRLASGRLAGFVHASLLGLDGPDAAAFLTLPLGLLFALAGLVAPGTGLARTAGPALLAAFLIPFSLDGVRFNHWRYHQALVPALAALATLGLVEAWRLAGRGGLARALLVLVAATHLHGTGRWLLQLAIDAGELSQQHLRTAAFLARTLPKDALPALNDAGALAHATGRRFLDLVGLVSPGSPQAFLRGTGSVFEELQARPEKPTHFCGHPNWFTGFRESGLLGPPLFEASLKRYESVGGASMILAAFDPAALAPEPAACLPTPAARDELDVALVRDETSHAYAVTFRDGGGPVKAVIASGSLPGCGTVLDGGYPVSGEESFTLGNLTPGKDALLFARWQAPEPTRVEIRLDDEPLGTLPVPGVPGWIPLRIPLPGSMITRPTLRVRILDLERLHYSFHYWVAQPGS